MVGGDWTGWSIVKNLTIHSTNSVQPDDVTLFNYHDSWFGSVGVQYKPTDDWKFSLGTGFDDTPTDTAYRTPGIPDGGRYWLSAGVGYKVNQNIDLDLSVARLIGQRCAEYGRTDQCQVFSRQPQRRREHAGDLGWP
jgi:long-chain fatty acid transport protein